MPDRGLRGGGRTVGSAQATDPPTCLNNLNQEKKIYQQGPEIGGRRHTNLLLTSNLPPFPPWRVRNSETSLSRRRKGGRTMGVEAGAPWHGIRGWH